MKPSELKAFGLWIERLFAKHGAKMGLAFLYVFVTFLITCASMRITPPGSHDDHPDWARSLVLWAWLVLIPAAAIAVNYPVYRIRSRSDRRLERRERLQKEIAVLERKLNL